MIKLTVYLIFRKDLLNPVLILSNEAIPNIDQLSFEKWHFFPRQHKVILGFENC